MQLKDLEFIECRQLSPEWWAARRNSVGSSGCKTAFAGGKGITREKLMEQMLREQHTGECEPTISTFDMRWGNEHEPIARKYFEEETGLEVHRVGMIKNKKYPGFHTSPDGLIIMPDGLYALEIKCPKFSTHKKYLDNFANSPGWTHPVEYKQQLRHHCVIPECKGVFFVSFFPDENAIEILGDGHPWAQIISFVPPPSPAEVAGHIEGMRKWNIDYAKMLPQAGELASKYQAEKEKENDNFVASIKVAATKNEELLEMIR